MLDHEMGRDAADGAPHRLLTQINDSLADCSPTFPG
jgi:hypothetical protein